MLNTAQKEIVAQQLIDGIPQRQIAISVGVTQPTISNFNRTIKPQIEAAVIKSISVSLNKVVDTDALHLDMGYNLTSLLHTCNTNAKYKRLKSMAHKLSLIGMTAKELLILADRKGGQLKRNVGIDTAHAVSPVIQVMGDININTLIDPGVQQALGSQIDSILSIDNVTDADYTEDTLNTGEDS